MVSAALQVDANPAGKKDLRVRAPSAIAPYPQLESSHGQVHRIVNAMTRISERPTTTSLPDRETDGNARPDVAVGLFRHFAAYTAAAVGSPWAFLLALAVVVTWALLGPHFNWSSAHQLVINTLTTIVTFLIVFLIQNTQNRDTKSLHLKIDELLKATRGARNSMIDLDRLSDEQLAKLEKEFKSLCLAETSGPVDQNRQETDGERKVQR
jgi:low affinity Fe/Cu permease